MHISFNDDAQPATPRQRRILKLVGCVLLLAAPLWFLGAGYFLQSSLKAVSTWTAAEARVVALVEDRDEPSVVFPLFQFTAADGKSYEVKGNHGSSMPEYGVGDMIPILYPEDTPEDARENSPMALYMAPGAMGILGLADFLFGCLFFYASRREDLRVTPN